MFEQWRTHPIGTLSMMATLPLFVAACASGPDLNDDADADGLDQAPVATAMSDDGVLVTNDQLALGQEVVETTCAACHTLQPPPNLAPPLLMVVGHYMEEYGEREPAAEAMRAWLAGPDSSHSALPAHAIERFGLMPPLPLPDEQRVAAVEYLLTEFDARGSEHMGAGMGRGMGQMGEGMGQGMRRRGGPPSGR